MKFWNFGSENCGGSLVANFLCFPQEIRLRICHRKLHHIVLRKQRNLSPGLGSGGGPRTPKFGLIYTSLQPNFYVSFSSIFRHSQALSGKIRGMNLHDLPWFHMILHDPQEPRNVSTDGKNSYVAQVLASMEFTQSQQLFPSSHAS